jgi:peptidoglycan/LPS O-acetylase OafA/YrhL
MGLSMTFIVLAFSLGHGGWLLDLAKAQWWQPLSRLTFGVYLVHPMLIFFAYTSSLDLIYFQPLTVLTNVISLAILSFCISFILFVLVTLPCSRMGRALIWGVQIGHVSRRTSSSDR